MSAKPATVTHLDSYRARKRHPAGSAAGGRFAPSTRSESDADLPAALLAACPDPWGDNGDVGFHPKIDPVPAPEGADGSASSTPATGTGERRIRDGGPAREKVVEDLNTFTRDYADGFAGSLDAALGVVDRLTPGIAKLAPCLSASTHRQLASTACQRVVAHVNTHRNLEVGQVVDEFVIEVSSRNSAAYRRGLRAPTPSGR